MTKQQLYIFTISVLAVFSLLYTAVSAHSTANELRNNVEDIESQVEELQSQIEDLQSELERFNIWRH